MKHFTKATFEEEVLNAEKPVLVDFWAVWCGPCQMMAPVLEEVEKDKPQIIVGKINVDEEPELAAQFEVSSIPTLMLFEHGKMTAKAIGFMQKEELCDSFKL